MKEKLKTVYVTPQNEVSDDVVKALIVACKLNTPFERFKKILCDGRTTNLVEHLKPEYLDEYLSNLKDIHIEIKVKDTDNK